ncbi:hypothetical protein EfmAA290_19300 [Enterococcus faecium]|nr:hypothetical protein EfmAA290_19300 [Enterococcus faecium]
MWKDQAKVWTTSGEDVTEAYKNGAIKAYQKLQEKHIDLVIMKEKSPSCGTHSIYEYRVGVYVVAYPPDA